MSTDTDQESKFETQIVNIAGEMVAFTPTGLPKGEFTIVQFDDYYKPKGMSESDKTILVNALRDLFSSTSLPIFDKELGEEIGRPLRTPILPPCDEIQKKLVMESLQYRFDLLRQELYVRGIRSFQDIKRRMEELKKNSAIGSLEGKDTLDVRRNLKHFYALKKLMDDYESSQQCFILQDKAFGELELDLTDDRARELLKQFIFFTLQAHHPLQEFKKTDPTAPAFVKRLELKPLKDQFPKFMTTYKGNKLPIPDSIARVLESIEAEPGILDEEVKRRMKEALDEEKQKILKFVLAFYPETDFFWRTIGKEKDVYRIVEKLMELLREAKGEAEQLEKANIDLDTKRKTCESTIGLLRDQLNRITADAKKLREQLEAAGKQEDEVKRLTEALRKATEENAAKQARATQQLEEAARQKAQNDARIRELVSTVERMAGQIEELTKEVGRLQLIEDAAKADARALAQAHQKALQEERARTEAQSLAKQTAERARDDAERELSTARTAILGKDEIIRANKEQILALEKAVSDCTTQSETLRGELSTKTSEVERLSKEFAAMKAKKEELEANQATLLERIETAEGDVESLKNEVADLRKEIAALNFDLSDKEAALLAAKAEIASLSEKADLPTQEIAKLKADLEGLKAEVDAAKLAKETLTAEIERLETELKQRNELYEKLKAECDTQASELKSARAEGAAARGKIESISSELNEARERISKQEADFLKEQKRHGEEIAELTETYKGQVDAATAEVATERKRADTAEENLEQATTSLTKQKEIYDELKDAIQAFLTIEDDPAEVLAPLEQDVKDNLRILFSKLQAASRSSSPPSSPTARRAENMLNQCQNVLLLTYLWQTNFPTDDEESQTLYQMINTIFSSGPYPGRQGRTLPGVYEGNPLNAKLYAPLLKKLLSVFYFGNPLPQGAAAAKEISVTSDEITLLEKLLRSIPPIETAYKAGQEESTSGEHETSFLAEKSRLNMIRHHPNLETNLAREYLKLDNANRKVYCILGEESSLSYPSVFYMFMIVLRDSLDQVSTSLSREGQCPLPKILRKA
jgi:predicted  nucleic acid-binding Zn-ribbon protein